MEKIKDTLKELVKAFCVCSMIVGGFLLFFRPAVVDGMSMYPTLTNGDILILNKNISKLKRGDIVAIKSDTLHLVLCKRVVGLEGDHLVINQDGLSVNGEIINEDYIYEKEWVHDNFEINLTVPQGNVFVLGDNRNNSSDSRTLGCLETTQILGILTSDVTKILHINSSDYKIILYILWLVFLAYYIVTFIVSFIKKRRDS